MSMHSEYSTLGEFFAKSSVLNAIAMMTANPPPTSTMSRFPDCANVLPIFPLAFSSLQLFHVLRRASAPTPRGIGPT